MAIDGDTADFVFGARNFLSVSARSALCDGVKFCWRDGFVRPANRSLAHNSSTDFERAAFNVVDEAPAFINLRAIWVESAEAIIPH